MDRYIRSMDPKAFPEPVSCRVIGIAEDAKFSNVRAASAHDLLPDPRQTRRRRQLVFLMNSVPAPSVAGYRKALSEIALPYRS